MVARFIFFRRRQGGFPVQPPPPEKPQPSVPEAQPPLPKAPEPASKPPVEKISEPSAEPSGAPASDPRFAPAPPSRRTGKTEPGVSEPTLKPASGVESAGPTVEPAVKPAGAAKTSQSVARPEPAPAFEPTPVFSSAPAPSDSPEQRIMEIVNYAAKTSDRLTAIREAGEKQLAEAVPQPVWCFQSRHSPAAPLRRWT